MAYRKIKKKTLCSIEITETHTARCRPPGMGRAKKENPTPEAMQRSNQRMRERRTLILMRNNFRPGDCYQTHTWSPDKRPPDMESAVKELTNFWKRVRRRYERYEVELKYLCNIEVGPRGAWHVHVVVNEVVDEGLPIASAILRNCWKGGSVKDTKELRKEGAFRDLAKYLAKDERSDPEKVTQARHMHSRNLEMPKEEVKDYKRRQVIDGRGRWKEIKVPEGYYLEKESLYEGINLYTGYPYRTYSLIRAGT